MALNEALSGRVSSWDPAREVDWERVYVEQLPRVYNFFRFRVRNQEGCRPRARDFSVGLKVSQGSATVKKFVAVMMLAAPPFSQDVFAAESAPSVHSDGIELRELIEIAAERLNKRFIIDPRVTGTASVAGFDPRKLTYAELQSILSVHGFVTTQERNGTIEILPDAVARQIPMPLITDKARNAGDEDVVTKTIDVGSLNAAQLVPILRPLLPQYAHLVAHSGTNTLIVVARHANIQTLESVVRDLQKRPMVAPQLPTEAGK